jgi:hypothetical protein
LKNPYIATIADKKRIQEISQTAGAAAGRDAADAWTRELKAKGHDGVFLALKPGAFDKGKPQQEIVVFDPPGVKSATGNRGTFNPNSPKINESLYEHLQGQHDQSTHGHDHASPSGIDWLHRALAGIKANDESPRVKGKRTGSGLREVSTMAFTGEPVKSTTKLSKQDAGALGEKISIDWLHETGRTDARPLNAKVKNFPIDVVQDHGAYEIKTGLVSNGKSAQKWRATIGEPGKAEKAMLAQMTDEQKEAWNDKKREAILARKQAALKQISKELGKPVKAKTVTLIIDPDRKIVDVYEFDGFHLYIGWKSSEAKTAYRGSYEYK